MTRDWKSCQLDSKKEDWARAMKDEKMGWPNISDLKGWKSEIAALYFVRGIPHMLLLDENNRIVAKTLLKRNWKENRGVVKRIRCDKNE